jgi:type I restriction enzyme M protein
MLAPNGRMAIVLPRGILKNYSDEYVRRFILRYAKVRTVVSLGGDMFKPFTNTKTCVLFLQKRPKPFGNVEDISDDPPIVFSVTERPGKDKSGNIIFDEAHEIVTDLSDIAAFVRANNIWN